MMRDWKIQNYTKYINVIYYHIWGLVEDRKLRIEWIPSLSILASSLTKALPAKLFKRHQDKWSLVEWKDLKSPKEITEQGRED